MRRTNALKWLISAGVMAFAACSEPETAVSTDVDGADGVADDTDGSVAVDTTDVTDGTDATEAGQDSPDATDGSDGTDAVDATDGGDVTDGIDDVAADDTTEGDADATDDSSDDATDGTPSCPCALPAGETDCDWCDLENTNCSTSADCIAAATGLADAQKVSAQTDNLGVVIGADYPDCHLPVCEAGKCVPLTPVAGCCTQATDCGSSDCLQPSCVPDLDAAPAVSGAALAYCLFDYSLAQCCDGAGATVSLNEQFETYTTALTANWSAFDANTADSVRWWVLKAGDARCHNGGCVHLGSGKNEGGAVSWCYTTFSGLLDAACQALSPASNAIRGTLFSPTIQLKEATGPDGQPWALTFRVRMEGDAAPVNAGDLDFGDELQVIVKTTTDEQVVFSSTSFDNNTAEQYRLVTVDLTQWRGQPIQVAFAYDTKDASSNLGYEGVYLDDVRIASLCGTTACADSGSTCTASGGKCDDTSCAEPAPTTPLASEDPEGFCLVSPKPNCILCASNADCVSADPSLVGTCGGSGNCTFAASVCPEVVLTQDFEATVRPASFEYFDDTFCDPDNAWSSSNNRSSSGARSLYFGHVEACQGDYLGQCGEGDCGNTTCNGQPTRAWFITPKVTLPASETVLAFDLFLSSEFEFFPPTPNCGGAGEIPCTDRLRVIAITGPSGAPIETVVWDSYNIDGDTGCAFVPVTVNVSSLLGATDARFRFDYDSGDGSFNDGEGAYVDNLRIFPTCTVAGETCPSGSASECTVTSACEKVECVAAQCVRSDLPASECCDGDDDCDADGNACTLDVCDLATKTCKPTVLSTVTTCCQADAIYESESFNGEALPEEWTTETPDGSPEAVAWYFSATGGKGGTGGLAFNNAATGSFENAAAVMGTITSPAIAVPFGPSPTLVFDLKLDTQLRDFDKADYEDYLSDADIIWLDRLAAYAAIDGTENWALVWRSDNDDPVPGSTWERDQDGNLVALEWREMAFALDAFRGKTVRVRFEFDSFDKPANGTPDFAGAFIDNVRLSQACAGPGLPNPCIADAWCWDGDKCTIDMCATGECLLTENIADKSCCFPVPVTTQTFDSGPSGLNGWQILNGKGQTTPTDSVRWHYSTILANDGVGSLRFGDAAGEDYSSCSCTPASGQSCDGSCPIGDCTLPSGATEPAGAILSPVLTVKEGEDYDLRFALRPELSVDEGSVGFVEDFSVELMYQSGTGLVSVATLVCHGNKCDDPGFDPCKSGINFKYPGCLGEGDPGDYGAWRDYEFKLSDVLCSANNAFAQTFLGTVAVLGEAQFQLKVSFKTVNNADNCGAGLFFDEFSYDRLCTGWDATCE